MKTPDSLRKTALFSALLLSSAWFFAGCQTTETRTIDSTGPESLNTAAINPQDWANAADQLVQSLLSGGALEKAPRQPAILAIDRVINNTSLSIDTDLLIKKIRVALIQSGKVAVTNTMGLGERAVVASEAAEMNEMTTGQKIPPRAPDYTLYAKLIQQTDRANGKTQNTYTFQMSLVDVRTGLTAWEEEKEIAKQTRRATVGW
jgi:uncharacterized protein (TIGR02722 family)